MYLEPARKHRIPKDDTSIGMRLALLGLVVVVLFSVLGFRLWFLQVLSGDQYVSLADNNRKRSVSIEAPRGVIYDRNLVPLVGNRPGLSVGILPMDLRDEENVISRLAGVLDMPLDELQAKLEKAKKDPFRVAIVAEDVAEVPTVVYLKEHSLEFPGVRVEKTSLRSYSRPAFATHVLGYVGEVSEKDLTLEEFRSLKAGDKVGKDGVERTYDSFLRGTEGYREVEVDAMGRPKRVIQYQKPLPGNNIVLTIDYDLQEAAERAINEGIQRAQQDGFDDAAAGVVVAMNPQNGEILAMASVPDYDLSMWVGGMSGKNMERLTAKESLFPFLNRAIKGQYPPGSTFKAFVAATALSNGLVEWDSRIFCGPTFRIGEQVWRDWKPEGHGEVNLVEALMVSADVYFYTLAEMFYDQNFPMLQEGVRQFGFGQATGIDLPGEDVGRVPDKDWKSIVGKTAEEKAWRPGDEVNLSIGQGYMLSTPLQLAVGLSAIANGGKVIAPRIGMQITDSSGNVINELESVVRQQIELDPEDLRRIQWGLHLVTSEVGGTARAAFKGFPIEVAGKTGTAEKIPEDDYAWFFGYAPLENPEIVVVALVEQGGHGSSVAAPMVRRVMEAYFGVEAGELTSVQVTE